MRTDEGSPERLEREATNSIQYNPRDDISDGTHTPEFIREEGWDIEQGRILFAWKSPEETREDWNNRLLGQAELMMMYGGHAAVIGSQLRSSILSGKRASLAFPPPSQAHLVLVQHTTYSPGIITRKMWRRMLS